MKCQTMRQITLLPNHAYDIVCVTGLWFMKKREKKLPTHLFKTKHKKSKTFFLLDYLLIIVNTFVVFTKETITHFCRTQIETHVEVQRLKNNKMIQISTCFLLRHFVSPSLIHQWLSRYSQYKFL